MLCIIFQVCPPSLHISLSIWFKLYTLFENDCRALGEEIAEDFARSNGDAAKFGEGPFPLHIAKLSEVLAAKDRASEIREEINDLHEQQAVITLLNDNIDASEVIADAKAQIDNLTNELTRQVRI